MPNPVVWFEVLGQDPEKLQKFYTNTFGWQVNADNPMNYGMVDAQNGKGIGGGIGKGEGGAAWATFYIEVVDVEAILEQVEAHGGTVIVPTTTIPDMVTFGVFADPEGNKVGLVKSEQS
jgi:predicted enzyme related to lactoylglutathione lyase